MILSDSRFHCPVGGASIKKPCNATLSPQRPARKAGVVGWGGRTASSFGGARKLRRRARPQSGRARSTSTGRLSGGVGIAQHVGEEHGNQTRVQNERHHER